MEEVTKKVIQDLIGENVEPCISVYMPTIAAASVEVKMMPIQLKNLLNNVKKELLEKWNANSRDVEILLKPATDLLGDRVFWQNQKQGLALFINPEQFHYFRLNESVPEKSVINTYFNVIPLIPEVMFNNVYYVLTLSKNKNRVFRCTRTSIEQLNIEGIPGSLKEISQYTVVSKSLSLHSSGSEGGGAVFHGVGDIQTEQQEELLQYLRQIDHGLNKYLDEKAKSPLIVMSVKDIFATYSAINTYPFLLKDNMEGNPDECTTDLVLKGSAPLVADYFDKQLDDIINTYHNVKGTGKTSAQLEEIVSAAYFSRVEQLIVKNNAFQSGNFDPEENKVRFMERGLGQYNLYNFAVIKTIANGGQAYTLDEEKMPDGKDIIAFFRY